MPNSTTEKEVNRLAAIVRIHHSIGAILDLSEIARILVRELTDMMGCDTCAIMLVEEHKVKILAERGFSKTFGKMEFNEDIPAIKHVLSTKQTIFTGDVLSSPVAGNIPYGCFMNSLICVPIIVDDEVKGIIHLDSMKKDAFDNEDLEFTELLAKEVADTEPHLPLFGPVRLSQEQPEGRMARTHPPVEPHLAAAFIRDGSELELAARFLELATHTMPLPLAPAYLAIPWLRSQVCSRMGRCQDAIDVLWAYEELLHKSAEMQPHLFNHERELEKVRGELKRLRSKP